MLRFDKFICPEVDFDVHLKIRPRFSRISKDTMEAIHREQFKEELNLQTDRFLRYRKSELLNEIFEAIKMGKRD